VPSEAASNERAKPATGVHSETATGSDQRAGIDTPFRPSFHSTGWRSFRLARGLVRACQGKRVTDSGCLEKGLSAFLLAVVLIAGEVREATRDRGSPGLLIHAGVDETS
jgi:hypothetical protein